MHKKAILFDFDGTIADTVGSGVAIFNELARRRGFVEITEGNSESLREKGPREAMRALSVSTLSSLLVLRKLRLGLKEVMPTLGVMDGMRAALLEFKRRGYVLAIVTSNSKENVTEFLQANQIDFFDHIQAGSSLFRKRYAIKKTMLLNRLTRPEVIFVGDEIRDIEAAQNMGIEVIAVTWGINSKAGLLRANPDFIVDTAEELLELLK